jgi:hypothetical protein
MAQALRKRGEWLLTLATLVTCVLTSALVAPSVAASNFGVVQGVVVNPGGTPQMGANVKLIAENADYGLPAQLFTNQHGAFADTHVPPGIYEVQVTLAGYLPSIQRHIRVVPNLTTLVKVELNTVFASLDRLRRVPDQSSASDDWKWVLRTAVGTHPVLEWTDPQSAGSSSSRDTTAPQTRAQLELTSGSQQPGSISDLPEAPATAFGYDQPVGSSGHLLLAGQMSYGEGLPSVGLATAWMPSGEGSDGPVTEMVVRQVSLGVNNLVFRGERVSQHDTMEIGDRLLLHYGADLVSAQLAGDTKSFRPSADLHYLISRSWQANVMVVSGTASEAMTASTPSSSALEQLDNFPVLMVRDGRPVLAGGWHEEAGVHYAISKRASIEAAAFHDQTANSAVFGRGVVGNPDFLQDPFSNAFVYDAGGMGSWGGRIAFKQKISSDYEIAAVYAYAGALSSELGPENGGDSSAPGELRDGLGMHYHHTLAARFSGKTHRTGTQFSVGYKWINGQALTRVDPYSETAYDIDPYLSVSIRQALPGSLGGCRWEALADFRNLLGQGYVPVSTQDGQVVLMSAARSFRGGISFQF